jgi:uncharacterized protein (TIGR00299 family) protein
VKALRFDSVGGASGDMILGALCDLGVQPAWLQSRLEALLPGEVRLTAEKAEDRGIHGTRVTVKVLKTPHGHGHRTLADISQIIESGGLPGAVRELALVVFTRLAEAEARVHGVTANEVHFHEVGAADAVADIVGSALALDHLGIGAVIVGPLPTGCGTTEAAHGVLPLPVPAVAELLKGHPVVATKEPFELVTPTGAAILTGAAAKMGGVGDGTPMTIRQTGYGLGHRRLAGRANVIRATVLEVGVGSPDAPTRCLQLECNLDDMSPELIGSLFQGLFAAGALEVFTVPAQMKKQRPGVLLSVLCRFEDRERVLDTLFRGSTTFGVRETTVERTVLERRMETVSTPYGPIRVKCGLWQGDVVTRAPEYEDCVEAAKRNNVPVRRVYESAIRAL